MVRNPIEGSSWPRCNSGVSRQSGTVIQRPFTFIIIFRYRKELLGWPCWTWVGLLCAQRTMPGPSTRCSTTLTWFRIFQFFPLRCILINIFSSALHILPSSAFLDLAHCQVLSEVFKMHSGRLVCHFSALTHVMQEVLVFPEEVNVEVVATRWCSSMRSSFCF